MHKFLLFLLFPLSVNATVVNWHLDEVLTADTFLYDIPYMPNEVANVYVRVNGLDAPEATEIARCAKERRLGIIARDYVKDLIKNSRTVKVDVKEWGRSASTILADITVDGADLKELIIAKGYGRKAFGIRRYDWCEGKAR